MGDYRFPIIEEVSSGEAPCDVFERFSKRKLPFFLDSGMDAQKLGRYSFIGSDPFLILRSRGDQITIEQDHGIRIVKGNPFDTLQHLLETYRMNRLASPVPFMGGAVGYLSYDLCHFIEKLPQTAVDDLQLPECYMSFYDLILAFDHITRRMYLISTGFPEQNESARVKRAGDRLAEVKKWLMAKTYPRRNSPSFVTILPVKQVAFKSGFSRESYITAVDKARQYIIDGDIFEINISQRFETEVSVEPFNLYSLLRQINPAPFACFMDFEDVTIASSSPERFLRLHGDWAETRPIKGTRPRGKTNQSDRKLAHELLTSAKDKAENMMIVDLERNDLGRVCRYGTIKVTELAILETFPTLFHLTSTVVGQLNDGINGIDLLKATFPGGSITGAPKIRSMEIIDELEPTRRSIYTGSIGYLDFNGDMDLNIAIRTILIKKNKAYFQVGGAVVYDSDPEAEYEETIDKAKALIAALRATAGHT